MENMLSHTHCILSFSVFVNFEHNKSIRKIMFFPLFCKIRFFILHYLANILSVILRILRVHTLFHSRYWASSRRVCIMTRIDSWSLYGNTAYKKIVCRWKTGPNTTRNKFCFALHFVSRNNSSYHRGMSSEYLSEIEFIFETERVRIGNQVYSFYDKTEVKNIMYCNVILNTISTYCFIKFAELWWRATARQIYGSIHLQS